MLANEYSGVMHHYLSTYIHTFERFEILTLHISPSHVLLYDRWIFYSHKTMQGQMLTSIFHIFAGLFQV